MEMEIEIGYGINRQGVHITLMAQEYTLCGMATDEIDCNETHPQAVTCPDCVFLIRQLKGVKISRPTTGAADKG